MVQLQKEYEGFTRFGVKELKNSEDRLKIYFSNELETSSLFLMPLRQSDSGSTAACETLVKELIPSLAFRQSTTDLKDIFPGTRNPDSSILHFLVFENIEPVFVKQVLLNKIREISGKNHRSIRYNKFGLFIPRTGKIICFSFAHSGSMYYRYRLAEFKLQNLPSGLSNYLLSTLSYCPNEYFFSGSRASGFFLNLKVQIKHSNSHKLCCLASRALRAGKFKSNHENVEKYFLESDPETIACEVPVWYEEPQNSKLQIEGVLTGHIDVLRYEKNGMIGIWDYKPRARYEKKAHVQVYLYALMLSQRTGFPLKKFLCGYFDSLEAYFFNAGDADYY